MTTNAQIEDYVFAHRADIAGYEENVRTPLTPEQREFIEGRLSAELAVVARFVVAGAQSASRSI